MENLWSQLFEKGKIKHFVEYFITIGLDETSYLDRSLYQQDIMTLNLSHLIQPKLINKFPPIDKNGIMGVNEEVIDVTYNNLVLFSQRI